MRFQIINLHKLGVLVLFVISSQLIFSSLGFTQAPMSSNTLDRLGIIARISIASDASEANDISTLAAISQNGRYIAFDSNADNLVLDDSNNQWDIFLHDLETGITELISVASDGTHANWQSDAPSISADGRYVTFRSWANNLVPNDTNGTYDIFIRDRLLGITERVSVSSNGIQGNGASNYSSVSADGLYVVFFSSASNLIENDTNNAVDVFIRDRNTDETDLVSISSNGTYGNGTSAIATTKLSTP